MIYLIYFSIGFVYWFINSFVRKLDTEGDWLLPLVWFVAWPIPILTWLAIAFILMCDSISNYINKNHFGKRF